MDIAWCADGSSTADRALAEAPPWLKQPGRRDHVLVVVPPVQSVGMTVALGTPYLPEADLVRAAEEEGRIQLDLALARLSAHGAGDAGPPVGHLLHGDPATRLQDWLAHHGPDLVVLGTHGRGGVSRVLLGSVADHLIRHASCPVLLIPDRAPPPEPKGCVAYLVDSEAMADLLIPASRKLLVLDDHPLEVVTALHPPPILPAGQAMGGPLVDWEAMATLEAASARALLTHAATLLGGKVATHLLMGPASTTLADWVRTRRPGLVVLATHARSLVARAFLGSVADHLIRHAPAPLLILRGPTPAG